MATATPLTVEPDQRTLLETLASARTCSPEVLLREAIDEYVQRIASTDDFYAEGEAAWNEFQENGLHLTWAEVDDWLGELQAGKRVSPPPCHT